MPMHKLLAKISLRKSVERPLHHARLSTPSCARCYGKTFRVSSTFGHSGTMVNLSNRLSGKVRSTCLLAARKVILCNTGLLCLNPTALPSVIVHGCAQPKQSFAANAYFSQKERLQSDKKSTALGCEGTLCKEQDKHTKNGDQDVFFSSHVGKGKLAGEAISLFSVDQIREQESPWKALTGIANTDRLTRRGSPFKRRLQERKKICMLYGNLQRRTLNRYLKEIHRPEELLVALESRLDVLLKRSALFPSIHSARQSILQGGISVNGTKVRSPRYHCTPGDLIEIIQKKKHVCKPKICLSQAKGENQIKRGQQNRDYLTRFDKWLDLFASSELLQLGDRKIGRLYTSALSHVKESMGRATLVKSDSSFSVEEHRVTKQSFVKQGKANHLEKASLLQDTPSNKSSFVIDKANLLGNQRFGNQRFEISDFQVDTPFVSPKSHVLTSVNRKARTVDQGDSASITCTSLDSRKDSTKNHTFKNQSFASESVESERSRAIASRPLHLEVSYRNLCVVFLYPPQRICVDISIDFSLLV